MIADTTHEIKPLPMSLLERALQVANGVRRTRTATLSEVLDVLRRVARGESGKGIRRTFGTVAGSYKYRAYATQLTVVRVGEELRVKIGVGNAARVAGGGSDYVESTTNRDVRALLESSNGAIVLYARDV